MQMPYLHWETDRRRSRFDEMMQNITDSHQKKQKEMAKNGNSNTTSETVDLSGESARAGPTQPRTVSGESTPSDPPELGAVNGENVPAGPDQLSAMNVESAPAGATQPAAVNGHAVNAEPSSERLRHDWKFRKIRTATEAVTAKVGRHMHDFPHSKIAKTALAKKLNPQPLEPPRKLGRVLFQAAQLYEAMDYYQEQELLKEYLHHDPPFHPRRTLDQSYYWTLKTTKKRDRDQVVYRGTAPRSEFRHDGTHAKFGCEHCHTDIRKVPRVIMVDQLWLWILDGSKWHQILVQIYQK